MTAKVDGKVLRSVVADGKMQKPPTADLDALLSYIGEALPIRAMICISSPVRESASKTMAAGLPRYLSREKESICRNRYFRMVVFFLSDAERRQKYILFPGSTVSAFRQPHLTRDSLLDFESATSPRHATSHSDRCPIRAPAGGAGHLIISEGNHSHATTDNLHLLYIMPAFG